MKIDLTKEEWEFLKNEFENNKKYILNGLLERDDEMFLLLNLILQKLGSEWVDGECNATLPCGYENGKEPRFTYD
jgi:hypothetical protein